MSSEPKFLREFSNSARHFINKQTINGWARDYTTGGFREINLSLEIVRNYHFKKW